MSPRKTADMNAKDRRTRQREELKGLILDAARDIFLRDGDGRISMRQLAGKIDYSPGTIYLHFPSKDALLSALVEESFAKLSQALRKTRRDDPVETLRLGLKAYVHFGLRHPNHYRFAFMRQPKPGPYRTHDAFEYLRECVRRCIEAGRFRGVDAETSAQLLWAGVHGLTSLFIARRNFPWVRREALIDELIGNSIRGLLAEGQGGP
jgi:AcrR family transcriptional regulator